MAKVEFKEGQPVQSLSGKIGSIVFKTMNGRTFVHEVAMPELPDNATRKQKAAYKRKMIIEQCVEIIQREMELTEALAMRKKIHDRIRILYDKYAPEIKARTKLQCKIMGEYRARYQ